MTTHNLNQTPAELIAAAQHLANAYNEVQSFHNNQKKEHESTRKYANDLMEGIVDTAHLLEKTAGNLFITEAFFNLLD